MTATSGFARAHLRSSAILGSLALAALVASSSPAPARADTAATIRDIVLGAVPAAAGILINNGINTGIANGLARTQVLPGSVVGHTRDGGVVYGDGRIVYPNGSLLYASNGDGRVCSYAAGYGERCGGRPVAYHYSGSRAAQARKRDWEHDRGRHTGQIKHGVRDGDEHGRERGEHNHDR